MKNFLIRHWLILLILFLTAAVTVYWFSWHLKPFTPNAFVFADTRPVSPLVEGFITEIHVKNNQFVKKGGVEDFVTLPYSMPSFSRALNKYSNGEETPQAS